MTSNEENFNVKLIKEVEKFPCLYNYKLSEYSNKNATQKAWEQVAKEVKVSVKKCKERWTNLRTVFVRKLKILHTDSGSIQKSKSYYLMDIMQFIMPFVKGRSYEAPPLISLSTPSTLLRGTKNNDFVHSENDTEVGTGGKEQSFNQTNKTVQRKRKATNKVAEHFQNKKKRPVNDNDSKKYFLLSLLPDLQQMSNIQMRQFKKEVIGIINRILDEPSSSTPTISNEWPYSPIAPENIPYVTEPIESKKMEMSSFRKPRHILSLTSSERKQFLDSFDFVFCDCDGVVWKIMQQPIDNVGKGIEALKSQGKKCIFVTNNSVRSVEAYARRFNEAKIKIDLENDVVHPVKTIVKYLKKINFDGLIYCIATETFKSVLKDAGYQIIDGPNKILEENFSDLAKNVFDKEPVRAVIIDVDYNLSAPKLIKAHLYLKNSECLFIGGAADRIIPFSNTEIIGPGPYIKIVENTTEKIAKIFGKPGKELGDYLIEMYNIENPKRALFIGDILETDIGFGKLCGFQTLCVLTGATNLCDLDKIKNYNEIPDYYADSLYDFEEFLKTLNG